MSFEEFVSVLCHAKLHKCWRIPQDESEEFWECLKSFWTIACFFLFVFLQKDVSEFIFSTSENGVSLSGCCSAHLRGIQPLGFKTSNICENLSHQQQFASKKHCYAALCKIKSMHDLIQLCDGSIKPILNLRIGNKKLR